MSLRERIARRLFVWAYKIGGPAEFERSKEHVRVIPSASQVEQAALRQRELLDMVEETIGSTSMKRRIEQTILNAAQKIMARKKKALAALKRKSVRK